MKQNKIFLGSLLIFVLFWMTYLFKPFILNITIASLLAVAMSSLNISFFKVFNNHFVSSFITTLLLFILFFVPILYTAINLIKVGTNFDLSIVSKTINYFYNLDLNLPKSIEFLEPKIKELIHDINVSELSKNILAKIATFGKQSAAFFTDMFLIIIFFFFANLYGKNMIIYVRDVLPMKNEEIENILTEVANVMSVVFYSIILNSILQGFLFAIISIIYGYDGILFGILYGFSSLIPVIGGALMWLPVSAYEFSNGHTSSAIIIALYSIIMISVIADTFIKPLIIKYINKTLVKIPTQINELVLFFAMIAGLTSFGFWGMILGPAIVTLFISVLKIFKALKENRT